MESPRRGGNAERLVDEALRGEREVGAETEKTRLAQVSINACLGCCECPKKGQCVEKDDFVALREKMLDSPVWLLRTSIYFFSPSGQLQTFIDRWISIPRDKTEGRRAWAIVTLEETATETARATVEALEQTVRERRMEFIGAIVTPRLLNVETLRSIQSASRQQTKRECRPCRVCSLIGDAHRLAGSARSLGCCLT